MVESCPHCGVTPCFCAMLAAFPTQKRKLRNILRRAQRLGPSGIGQLWMGLGMMWPGFSVPTERGALLASLKDAKALARAVLAVLTVMERELEADPHRRRWGFQVLRGGKDG